MARELKKDGVLTVINNEEELPDAMNMLLSTTPEFREEIKTNIKSRRVNLNPLIQELSL